MIRNQMYGSAHILLDAVTLTCGAHVPAMCAVFIRTHVEIYGNVSRNRLVIAETACS